MASRVLKLLQDNTTLNNNLKSMVFRPDTNTITFLNPTPQRGDVNSVKFIKRVNPGDLSSSLPALNGPSQPVDIYQITYYSSNPANNNGVELVSGTMFIPQTITKSTIIEHGRGSVIHTVDKNICSWLVASDPAKWDNVSPANRVINQGTLSGQITWASLGYVVIAADGFGLGVSLNRVSINSYFGDINPSVDIIRAFKKYEDYTVSIQSDLFQNKFNNSVLDIIHVGYSRGGLLECGIANELKPGVSQSIPAAEASQFNSKKILLGAAFSPKVYFNYLVSNANNPATRYITPTYAQFVILFTAGQYDAYNYLTNNFKQNIAQLFQDDVTFGSSTEHLFSDTGLFRRIKYDYYSSISDMTTRGVVPPLDISLGPGLNAVAPDWKQMFLDASSIAIVGNIVSNNLPLDSRNRSLKDISNVPIAHIYSLGDEIINPPGSGIDMALNLANTNLGPDVNGPLDGNGNVTIVFKGANKVSSYRNITGGDLLTNPTSGTEAQMINAIVNMSNNQFINCGVNPTAYGAALSGHSAFSLVWINYLYLILAQQQ